MFGVGSEVIPLIFFTKLGSENPRAKLEPKWPGPLWSSISNTVHVSTCVSTLTKYPFEPPWTASGFGGAEPAVLRLRFHCFSESLFRSDPGELPASSAPGTPGGVEGVEEVAVDVKNRNLRKKWVWSGKWNQGLKPAVHILVSF